MIGQAASPVESPRERRLSFKQDFLLVLVLIPITAIVWIALDALEERKRSNLASNLQTVLETTQGGIRIWAASRKTAVGGWARSVEIRRAITQQLTAARRPEVLRRTPAEAALRKLLAPAVEPGQQQIGFVVLAPDGLQLAASGDALVGGRDVMAYASDTVAAARAGDAVLGLPFLTSAAIEVQSGVWIPAHSPAMISAAPVRDDHGQVMAVLALFIDPAQEFTRVTQLGRLGRTLSTARGVSSPKAGLTRTSGRSASSRPAMQRGGVSFVSTFEIPAATWSRVFARRCPGSGNR